MWIILYSFELKGKTPKYPARWNDLERPWQITAGHSQGNKDWIMKIHVIKISLPLLEILYKMWRRVVVQHHSLTMALPIKIVRHCSLIAVSCDFLEYFYSIVFLIWMFSIVSGVGDNCYCLRRDEWSEYFGRFERTKSQNGHQQNRPHYKTWRNHRR